MTHDDVPGRVLRLEESTLFTDRAVEDLGEAVREITGAIERLGRRIEALESRLAQLDHAAHADPGPEPPPHSAGPRPPREPI